MNWDETIWLSQELRRLIAEQTSQLEGGTGIQAFIDSETPTLAKTGDIWFVLQGETDTNE